MTVKPMFIDKQLITENTPYGGEWAIVCTCGDRLAFSHRDRGTEKNTLIVTHGDGEARLEVPGWSNEGFLWGLGLCDPLGAWLERIHEYEDGEEGL